MVLKGGNYMDKRKQDEANRFHDWKLLGHPERITALLNRESETLISF